MTSPRSIVDTTKSPIIAGATLSGCPPCHMPDSKSPRAKTDLSSNVFAAINPVMIAADDDPIPDDNRIRSTHSA
ncbi:MAG: hypothetical protein U0V48_11065 [Anaerolineales bacterium]